LALCLLPLLLLLPQVDVNNWAQVDWPTVDWGTFINVMFWNLNYWDSGGRAQECRVDGSSRFYMHTSLQYAPARHQALLKAPVAKSVKPAC
jgi:hypothetical protein